MKIGVIDMDDLQDRAGSVVNDSGTGEKSGTRLTQNRSPGVLGFTYFVRADDAIKIGSATTPKDRISALQTAHVKPLDILAVVPAAIVDEYKAHQLFAHLRIRGEWFRAEPELLYFIEQAKEEAAANPVQPEPLPPRSARSMPISTDIPPYLAMRRKLIALRVSVGPNTPQGRAASNLVEQLENFQTATGAQRDNLLKAIPYQMARLAG